MRVDAVTVRPEQVARERDQALVVAGATLVAPTGVEALDARGLAGDSNIDEGGDHAARLVIRDIRIAERDGDGRGRVSGRALESAILRLGRGRGEKGEEDDAGDQHGRGGGGGMHG